MGGLLAGLNEATGWDPRECEHFVGTSAGSIVAAALAGGVDPRTRLERLPSQPAAEPEEQPTAGLIGGALRFTRGAGANAFAPLAALALRSTAMSGAAVRRAALGRVPAGRRSLSGLGSAMADLGLDWDGRLLVVAGEGGTGRRGGFRLPGGTPPAGAAAGGASCASP